MDRSDRILLQLADLRLLPPVRLQQTDAVTAHVEDALEALVDPQEVGVLVEPRRVLEPRGAAQPVSQLHAERAQATGDGAGAAAAHAEHDDGAVPP
jgi:hypothetical protein